MLCDDAATTLAYLTGGLGDTAVNRRKYHVSTMYLEYANVADPADEVSVVAIDPADGAARFLALTGGRDFLRVPMVVPPPIDTTDDTVYPNGNRLVFFAESSGAVGVNGLPFGTGVYSKVYGVALVATPDEDDPSQDLVFARDQYTGDDQRLKQSGVEIGVKWPFSFTPTI